jgi:predicted DNA binding CopG/RHH family protein
MAKKMNNQQIPQIDSIEELAHFWDTHDLTDFENQLEEVTVPVFEREAKVTVQLQPEEVQAVKKIAASKGVDDTELIRQWVLEKLHLSQAS